jgi:hypothetical protein
MGEIKDINWDEVDIRLSKNKFLPIFRFEYYVTISRPSELIGLELILDYAETL